MVAFSLLSFPGLFENFSALWFNHPYSTIQDLFENHLLFMVSPSILYYVGFIKKLLCIVVYPYFISFAGSVKNALCLKV